jgi:hypothetical protein
MSVRTFALVFGIVFLAVGILGFIPGINQMHAGDDPNLAVEGPGHGHLLGLFHVNVLHNLVHVLFGILGLVMYRRDDSAVLYARIVAISYALLTIMGLIPALRYTFGLIPIEGNDVWLHALLAAVAAYFGFIHRRADTVGTTTTTTPTTPAT